MEKQEIDICYCCKNQKEGAYLDYNGETRFCCKTCNHIDYKESK